MIDMNIVKTVNKVNIFCAVNLFFIMIVLLLFGLWIHNSLIFSFYNPVGQLKVMCFDIV
jgi:hypothetical protein